MAIFIFRESEDPFHPPEDIGIVIEDIHLLTTLMTPMLLAYYYILAQDSFVKNFRACRTAPLAVISSKAPAAKVLHGPLHILFFHCGYVKTRVPFKSLWRT